MNQETESKHFPHDALYKRFFSEKEIVQLFIQEYVPKNLSEKLDLNSVQSCPTEFVGSDLQKRFCDRIWRAQLKGKKSFIYFMLEFQSSIDVEMALRLTQYKIALATDFFRKLDLKSGGRLPRIYPVLIYNGKRKWNAPIELSELFEPLPGENLEPKQHIYLGLYELKEEIEKKNDLLSRFFQLETHEQESDIQAIFGKVKNELKNTDKQRIRSAFLVYMQKRLEHAGADPKELEKIKTLEEMMEAFEGRPKWKDNYIAQGRAEGIAQTLIKLLNDRFGNIPESLSTQIMSISDANQLSDLTLYAYKIASLNEFKTLLH